MAEQAETDPLTGLANRRGLKNQFIRAFDVISRQPDGIKSLAVIFLDLDNFKLLNDTYGHGKGDEQLRLVGDTLRQMVRGGDLVARWGGEEFCLVVINQRLENVANMAQRIAGRYIRNQSGREISGKTISLGISMTAPGELYTDAAQAWTELNSEPGEIILADEAAYFSKKEKDKRLESGENQVSNISIYDRARERSYLLKDYDVQAGKPNPEALI